jgi:shikimate kinase
MNITLIGMPGSGKTFVGKILAETLGFFFFDADSAMEKEYGIPLPEILEKLKEKAFLDKEEQILISGTAGIDSTVISPGGSVVYSLKVMERLKKISVIVYLQTTLSSVEKRIGNVPRGIVGAKTKTMAQLFAQRRPLYEKWADITINGDQSAEKVKRDILRAIEKIKISR